MHEKNWRFRLYATLFAVVCAALVFGGNGCSTGPSSEGEPLGKVKQRLGPLDLEITSITIGPRVVPQGTLPVSITLKNTGTDTWTPANVQLAFQGEGTWTNSNLALPNSVAANASITFTGSLGAPTQIGFYTLTWRATSSGTAFGAAIIGKTEITCSDGVFCNGDERWVNGKCVAGPPPCDDGEACTADVCDEATKLCSHTLGANCNACFMKNCNPKCNGKACGDDSCGGSCGVCPAGQACSAGACVVAAASGSCANPLPIITGADPNAVVAAGTYTTTGDNTGGYDEIVPACDPVAAPEKIFKLVINQQMGIDAQSFGIDTVLSIYSGSCGGTQVKCNDDAAPPGNYGSHVYGMLQPGTYFIAVNGFDTHATGPFTLQIRLVPGCVPQCDGKFCGSDGCGGSCGACAAGEICNAASRCVANPCVPKCGGRQCGSDGCGGSCGTCQAGKACDEPTGACKNAPVCNHDKPVCATPCAAQEYCGFDCLCHKASDPRPDLVVDKARLQNEILFDTLNVSPSSCTVAENCVGGTGLRSLLRFSVEAVNQGAATLSVPLPKLRPDLFDFSSCHGHYHFKGFASYALKDLAGNTVVTGQKLAYCMEDTERVFSGPDVGCDKAFDCTNQGIQAGWADIYGNSLDCQWLDITGVPPGNYQLSVTVNPARYFEESSFDNNTATVPVTIPGVIPPQDAGADSGADAGTDSGVVDSGIVDSGATDSGIVDASVDAATDSGSDASAPVDSGTDAAKPDAAVADSGTPPPAQDASPSPVDASTPKPDDGTTEGSGCDCRSTGGMPSSPLGAVVGVILVLAFARRRHR